jgi:branched-chain amino acid transport system ATP-binding protein
MLIELRNVSGGYGPVNVLEGLDLGVNEGEVGVILGANGAGKTTTLRAICGMLDDVSGEVFFDGSDITGRSTEAIARTGIAHVPQGRGTFGDLSVEDNLRLGAIVRKDGGVDSDLERWFDVFPRLRERRDQNAGTLSGGEQQMLAIARAMMGRPRLLLLDEPSLGLAPLITRDLFERLGEINKSEGLTMLIVEQNAGLALQIADRGYVLETGTIVASGTSEELSLDEGVRKAYLGF